MVCHTPKTLVNDKKICSKTQIIQPYLGLSLKSWNTHISVKSGASDYLTASENGYGVRLTPALVEWDD